MHFQASVSPGIIDEAVGNVLCDLTVMVAYYRLAFTLVVKAIREGELISLFPEQNCRSLFVGVNDCLV